MKNLKFLITLVLILMLTVYGIKNQQRTYTTDHKELKDKAD